MPDQALDNPVLKPLPEDAGEGASRRWRKRWAIPLALLLLLAPALLYEWYTGLQDFEALEGLFHEAVPEGEMLQWAVGGPKSLAQLGHELGAAAGSGGYGGPQVVAAVWTDGDSGGGKTSDTGDYLGGSPSGGSNGGGGDTPGLAAIVGVGGGSPLMAALANPDTGGPTGGQGGGDPNNPFVPNNPDNPDDPDNPTNPVPEPGTMSLLALGGAVAALSRRLRR